ncbi:MAG: hypothetical protein ACRD29_23125 [Acidimicrobiales bacterium]
MNTDVEAPVAHAFREEWVQIVASLIAMTGEWDLAEDCAQEAFASALSAWRRDRHGVVEVRCRDHVGHVRQRASPPCSKSIRMTTRRTVGRLTSSNPASSKT